MRARTDDEEATYRPGDEPSCAFPPGRTALLVIDPVNDFLSDGGADWDLARTSVEKHDVVGHLRQAIDGARERQIPVLFAPMSFTEEDYAEARLHQRSGINRIMLERKMFLAGSWGADFHPALRPMDGDIVLAPHKSIDVFETDLPEHLERLGTTHLVIAGMTANLCCESTGRHAMEHGYDVTFLSDAIGADTLAAYEAAIRINYPLIARRVLEVSEFFKAVDAPPTAPRRGQKVVGSDRLPVGTIKKVVVGNERTRDHVVVRRGLFRRKMFVPLDAVTTIAGKKVFVNVPRLFVAKTRWTRRPTTSE